MRQQQTAEDEQNAHQPRGCDFLPQEHRTEDGGKRGAESAEQAGPLGGGVALGHGLERVAEAGADDGQGQDDTPLRAGLGQAGRFKQQ